MDLCELENAPEMQKCPTSFVGIGKRVTVMSLLAVTSVVTVTSVLTVTSDATVGSVATVSSSVTVTSVTICPLIQPPTTTPQTLI